MGVDEAVISRVVMLLGGQREVILAEAARFLECSHLSSYEKAGPRVTAERLGHLYDLVITAVHDRRLDAVVAHAEEVARERYAAGYDLSEVQRAYNVLEEAIWNHLLASVAPEQMATALGLVSTVLGAGKDRLAQEYVSLASQSKAPSLDLSALFSGPQRF